MTATLLQEIKQLPLNRKVELLESVWSDLLMDPAAVEVPEWHKNILDERQQLVQAGKAHFIDWSVAKQQVESQIQ